MKKILIMIPDMKKIPLQMFLMVFLLPLSAYSEAKGGSVELTSFVGYNFLKTDRIWKTSL